MFQIWVRNFIYDKTGFYIRWHKKKDNALTTMTVEYLNKLWKKATRIKGAPEMVRSIQDWVEKPVKNIEDDQEKFFVHNK
jgi:hypothetical protein